MRRQRYCRLLNGSFSILSLETQLIMGGSSERQNKRWMMGAGKGAGAAVLAWRTPSIFTKMRSLQKTKFDGPDRAAEVPFQPGERMFLPLIAAFSRKQ